MAGPVGGAVKSDAGMSIRTSTFVPAGLSSTARWTTLACGSTTPLSAPCTNTWMPTPLPGVRMVTFTWSWCGNAFPTNCQ